MNRSGNIGAAKNMDSVFADFTEEEVFQDLMFDEDDQLIEIVEGYTEDGNTVFEEDEEIFKIAHQIEDDDQTPAEVKKDTEELLGPDNMNDQKINDIENIKKTDLDDSQTFDSLKKNGESEADKELGLEKLDDKYNSTADASVKEEYEYDKEDEAEGSDTKFGNKELDNSAMPADDIKPTDDENYNATNDASVKEEYDYNKPDEAEGTDDKFGKAVDNTEMKPDEIAPNGDENYNDTSDASVKDEPFDEAFLVEAASAGMYVITEAKFNLLPKFKEYKELKNAYQAVEQAEDMLNGEGIETSASAEKIIKLALRIADVVLNVDAVFSTIASFTIVAIPVHLMIKGLSYLCNVGQEAMVKSYSTKVIPKLVQLRDKEQDEEKKAKIQKQIDDIKEKINAMKNNKGVTVGDKDLDINTSDETSKEESANESVHFIEWVHESEDEESCDCGKDECPICSKRKELAPTSSPIEDKTNDERHEESSGETLTDGDGEGIAPGQVDDNTLPTDDMTPEGSPETDNGDITDDSDKQDSKPVEAEKKEEPKEDESIEEAFNRWLNEESDLELPVMEPNETITPSEVEKAEDELEKSAPESDVEIKTESEEPKAGGTSDTMPEKDATAPSDENCSGKGSGIVKEEEDTTSSAAQDVAAMSTGDPSTEEIDPAADNDSTVEESFEKWLHEEDEIELPTESDVEAAAETEVADTESELDDDLAAVADDDEEGAAPDLEYDPSDEDLIDLAGGEEIEESVQAKKNSKAY